MTVKCKVATTRRKSRINPKLITNIVHFPAERRKEAIQAKWDFAIKVYLKSLNSWEFDIAKHILMFIKQNPKMIDPDYSCKVIPFPQKQTGV